MITLILDSRTVHSSDTASDVPSQVLKLPEPAPPKRKRKPGFNTGKAVTITDTSNWKREEEKKAKEEEKRGKEVEKQRRKEKQRKN